MATLLDNRLVADALAHNLTEWSGDAQRITRTVHVDDEDALLAAVAEAADAMDHHPQVDRGDAGVSFALWTHSQGGVTELDIALASRIDDLVLATQHLEGDAAGEVRSVVGATTDDGAVEGRTVQAQPTFPTPGQTTPARPDESTTGDSAPDAGGAGAPTLNEASAPRQDAGMIVAPDADPSSMEPQPGHGAAPGMHEPTGDPE